jgi:hypothetical protein
MGVTPPGDAHHLCAARAQAVNALIASRSGVFVSPAVSMWTIFVRAPPRGPL